MQALTRRLALAALLVAGCSRDSGIGVNSDAGVMGADLAGPLAIEVGVRACLNIASCLVTGKGVSNCTSGILTVANPLFAVTAHISPAEVRCFAAAMSCAELGKCFNGGVAPTPCSGSALSCVGTALVSCSEATGTGGSKGTAQFDCASVGLQCIASATEVDCGAGSCSGRSTACLGNLLQYCDGTILRQADCSLFGAICVAGALVNHCRGTGPACAGAGGSSGVADQAPLRCDGTVLVSCADAQEARFDCASLGLGCFAGAGGKAFGCANGNSCDPKAYADTCAGTVLTFCDDGVVATIDCATAGYTSCTTARCAR